VLDGPMMNLVTAGGHRTALDVGCGEGRFCRMLQAAGLHTVGVDPTARLIERARELDRGGDYRIGHAESLDVSDAQFDLVVSYLSLIDIADAAAAIGEMARVISPGGTLLIANLTGFNSAGQTLGWSDDAMAASGFAIDHYLEERADWIGWQGIRIQNWHRPLSRYMTLLLQSGLVLTHFSEPVPSGGDPARVARYRRAPWFLIMSWRKPDGSPTRPGRSAALIVR
jgi:SAM-dependent methyltransferase